MRYHLFLVNSVSLLIGISYGIHNPILPIFAVDSIGASYSDLGAIGVANFMPYVFVPLFVGMLLDKFNRGWILTVGVAINVVSTYALSIVHTVPEIIICRIGTGIAHAFFWPPCEAIISSVSSGADRVKNIAKFVGFFVAGFTIGPLLGSLFLNDSDSGYRLLFQFAAFVMAAALISSVSTSRIRTVASSVKISLSGFRSLISLPEMVLMLIYCTASFGVILAIYPAFLTEKGTSAMHVEILYFVFGISRIITLICAKKFVGHVTIILVASILSIGIGMSAAYFGNGLFWYAIALLTMGFGFSAIVPLTLEIALSRAKAKMSGSVIGAYESIFGIGWVIGPIIAGIVSQEYGGSAPYIVFAIFGFGVAFIAIARRSVLQPIYRQD
ncbi:MAG: major facilitator transporter family protein [Cenarchaeum symbiont of Oopsacas minuta]|nr:major facilitator transporter family protein [Cenarchaeum symbiont of Oopsacas minuta]